MGNAKEKATRITTKVMIDSGYIIATAVICTENHKLISAHTMMKMNGSEETIEKAEDAAIARALSLFDKYLSASPHPSSDNSCKDGESEGSPEENIPNADQSEVPEEDPVDSTPESAGHDFSADVSAAIEALKANPHRNKISMGTIIPSGDFRGSTFRELIEGKQIAAIQKLAKTFTPVSAEEVKVLAAARFLAEAYEKAK